MARIPGLLELSRERVRTWQRDGSVAAYYADEWARLLARSFDELRAMLLDESEHARALRQCTPFAGVADPRTRCKIWRDVRERFDATR